MLNEALITWLKEHAESLDADTVLAGNILPRLAQEELFTAGLPENEGGGGGIPSAAIAVVAGLAQHSMSAAFVYWAQRALIECVLASPNHSLVQRLLPSLLGGRLAGAPGLSNAMKFLGGLDQLQTRFIAVPEGFVLNGGVPWATNLQRQGFVAVLAAGNPEGTQTSVFAVPHDAVGLMREPDLDLVGLRGTGTASLRLADARLGEEWQIHPQAKAFLPGVRPMFVGMQCGLGLGLARASLRSAREALEGSRSVLLGELEALEEQVHDYWQALSTGIDSGRLREQPPELLGLRMRMVEIALDAVQLELQALGGRAYLRGESPGFTRRWREAAFLPIVTPTLAQLKMERARSNGAEDVKAKTSALQPPAHHQRQSHP
jgi:alkylation response protein AidB-like acyl-CoA dehydrogenase